MKLREAYEESTNLATQYRDALNYAVCGKVYWTAEARVSRYASESKQLIAVGLIDNPANPLVIVHCVDIGHVYVQTPGQIADWPYQAVDAFPELGNFSANLCIPGEWAECP